MKMTEHGSAQQLSSVQLDDFEHRLGATLPFEYRRFLLLHNGGLPVSAVFKYTSVRGEVMEFGVESFYSVRPKETLWTDIEYPTPRWDEWPEGSMAVADATGGTEFLLFLTGPRRGQVWFKDYDSCRGYDNPEEELYFVAPNFDEFIEVIERLAREDESSSSQH